MIPVQQYRGSSQQQQDQPGTEFVDSTVSQAPVKFSTEAHLDRRDIAGGRTWSGIYLRELVCLPQAKRF
jgi:hypothetical protein